MRIVANRSFRYGRPMVRRSFIPRAWAVVERILCRSLFKHAPAFPSERLRHCPSRIFWHNGAPGAPRGFDIAPDGKEFVIMVPSNDESSERQTAQIYVAL